MCQMKSWVMSARWINGACAYTNAAVCSVQHGSCYGETTHQF